MKTIKIAIPILAMIFLLSSCSKSEDSSVAPKVYPEENFLPAFLTNTNLQLGASFINFNDNYEFGLAFKPLVKGKINSIIVKIPQANNVIRVTLWDKATKAVITTENVVITATDRDVVVTKVIMPISLEKDKEYVISFNSNDYYPYEAPSPVPYGITCNNIVITDFLYGIGVSQTYPEIDNENQVYFGNVSFNFQQTE